MSGCRRMITLLRIQEAILCNGGGSRDAVLKDSWLLWGWERRPTRNQTLCTGQGSHGSNYSRDEGQLDHPLWRGQKAGDKSKPTSGPSRMLDLAMIRPLDGEETKMP